MKKKGRLEYSILNSTISTGIYVGRLLIQFVARSFFIHFLGQTYLGLNGLFTNVLSLLSMAELGVGASIVFALYKPLAEDDHPRITALMQLYARAYHIIGGVIGVLGLAIMPFLHLMINSKQNVPHLYLIFLLFLANSVASYFFTYKRSLITADQKQYVVSLNDFLFLVATNVVQIAVLYIHADFVLYLIIQILFTLAGNLCITWIANRRYPYLLHAPKEKVDAETADTLKKNVIGNISSTIGGQIVMSTDNILISAFVNLTAVGIYSNYTLLVNAVQNVCKQITNSITASIGNFAVMADPERNNQLFRRHFFVNHTLVFFTAIELQVVLNAFVQWWVGKDNVLPSLTATLIVFNYVIQVYRNTGFVFIQSFGLFWYQRLKPVFESIINLGMSLLLLGPFHMGINGVLLGTITSSLGFVIWYEAYVVYKYALKRPMREYITMFVSSFLEVVVAAGVIQLLVMHFITLPVGIVSVLVQAVVTGVLAMVVYIALYWRRDEFRYLLGVTKRLLHR